MASIAPQSGLSSALGGRQLTNTRLMKAAARYWLLETVLTGLNFVLINLVYESRWGPLLAHQIGMTTRIAYIFVIAYLLLRHLGRYSRRELIYVGLLWFAFEELFEWGGSLGMGRPVEDTLVGWNIFAGYMWPYVLAAYLSSSLIMGTILGRAGCSSGVS